MQRDNKAEETKQKVEALSNGETLKQELAEKLAKEPAFQETVARIITEGQKSILTDLADMKMQLKEAVHNLTGFKGLVRLVSDMDGSKALHTSDNKTVNLFHQIVNFGRKPS